MQSVSSWPLPVHVQPVPRRRADVGRAGSSHSAWGLCCQKTLPPTSRLQSGRLLCTSISWRRCSGKTCLWLCHKLPWQAACVYAGCNLWGVRTQIIHNAAGSGTCKAPYAVSVSLSSCFLYCRYLDILDTVASDVHVEARSQMAYAGTSEEQLVRPELQPSEELDAIVKPAER